MTKIYLINKEEFVNSIINIGKEPAYTHILEPGYLYPQVIPNYKDHSLNFIKKYPISIIYDNISFSRDLCELIISYVNIHIIINYRVYGDYSMAIHTPNNLFLHIAFDNACRSNLINGFMINSIERIFFDITNIKENNIDIGLLFFT